MSERQRELTIARKSALFAGVHEAVAARLLDASITQRFEPGHVLFREGDKPVCLHLPLDGLVGFQTTDRKANSLFLELTPAQPFVLAALMLDAPYLVNAQVLRPCRVMMFPGTLFCDSVNADLSLSRAVNRIQSEAMRTLIRHTKTLLSRTASERLTEFIVKLAGNPHGEATVTLPCDRQVLAGWLGILPTSMSRVFRQLEAAGVTGRGRQLHIRSVERLRRRLAGGARADAAD